MPRKTKIAPVLEMLPEGIVVTSSWLRKQGINNFLQRDYRKTAIFESIGKGAMIRGGDKVDYLGGIYALQNQCGLSFHPSAKTALSLQGLFNEEPGDVKQLFGGSGETLPGWFSKKEWGIEIKFLTTSFLPPELGLISFPYKQFEIQISNPARAMLEYLYFAIRSKSILEAFDIMKGLHNLSEDDVQPLLENCKNDRMKRVFLYLAEQARHWWFYRLDIEKIHLGNHPFSLVPGGSFNDKYKTTFHNELEFMFIDQK